MKSIRKTLCFIEKLLSCSFIENCSFFITQRHINHVKLCYFSIFDPLTPSISLNSFYGPIPSILTFDNIKLAIKSQSHDSMTTVWTCSEHNNLVKTIHSHYCEKITRLNCAFIYFNFLNFSYFWSIIHSPLHKVNICFFLISWNKWLE